MKTKLALILVLSALLVASLAWQAQAPTTPPAAKQETAKAAPQEEAPAMGVVPTGKTRFEGIIANTGGSAFLGGYFTVEIDQWTTPEEAAEWKQTLVTSGQKALLDKIWKAKQIGYLKIQNSMGKPLFFARAIPVPGGLVVRVLTNQPLGRGYGRAGDYPFGVLELIIPNEGKGSGTIVPMAQISFTADGTAQVEAYGNLPLKITEVGFEKKRK